MDTDTQVVFTDRMFIKERNRKMIDYNAYKHTLYTHMYVNKYVLTIKVKKKKTLINRNNLGAYGGFSVMEIFQILWS